MREGELARWKMQPRHRLDIGAADLVFAVRAATSPDDEHRASLGERALAERWLPRSCAVVAQSVRSGFDAYLTAAALPRGSEVITSGVTIPDMLRILRAHGLVPVPFDLDPHTLAPDVEGAARAISPRTRLVLFAHLFGGRSDLSSLVELASRAGLPFVEDCAQGFQGPGDWGHPGAEVSMFSFGIIKTATALGGAIFRVRDRSLAARISAVQQRWPLQPHAALRGRAARLLGLSMANPPAVYGLLAKAVASRGRDLDAVLASLTRGFGADDDAAFFASVRRRPSAALIALLDRRLTGFDRAALDARAALGDRLAASLSRPHFVPGARQPRRTHWLVPVATPQPSALVAALRRAGFDATRGATSLVAVPSPREVPHARATACEEIMGGIVYVPGYPAMGRRAEQALVRVLALSTEHASPRATDRALQRR